VNESASRLSHLIPPFPPMSLFRPLFLTGLAVAAAVQLAAEVPAPLAAPPAPAPTAPPPATPAFARPGRDSTGLIVDLPAADTSSLPADVIAQATASLKELVARQNALLKAADQPGADMDNIKRDIQTLLFDYDSYLRHYPTFAPGYVTYGILLGKVGMRRESAAILLKANQLDANLPLVKNQLGNYLAEQGEPIEAANYYLAAIRLAPKEPLYHYQLGTLLTEARDDFLKSGQWDRAQIDHTMQEAFKRAAELAPDNIAYAYAYAFSFYDLAVPDWDQALKVWGALEEKVSPGLEKDTVRLHAANILIKQKKYDYARLILNTVTVAQLQGDKQKLLDQLPAKPEK
jgi:tetratricopeptide (TPR) repeat protein